MRKTRGRNLNVVLEERRARRRSRLRALLLGAAVLAAGVVLFREWQEQRRRPPFTQHRVVVVPLENRTGDAALDTLGLVASDWVTRILGLYAPAREVVPTTTTLAYQHSAQLGRFDLLSRALQLARGTRSQIVVWGTFYRTGDSLRFTVEVTDLASSLMVGSVPQIAAPLADPMRGIDRLRSAVVGAILHTESVAQPIPRRVPELRAYQSYVNGLGDYMQRRYARAAAHFAFAAARDTSYLPHQIWLVDALLATRQFARADSAARALTGFRVTRAEEARAMRGFARVQGNLREAYGWSARLAAQNGADDLARYEMALAALALGRAREARRILGDMHPNYGVLHGRPDFYLHHAAAYHLLQNHRLELRVVRAGLKARHRSLDVRLANCRARAAGGNADDALAALDAIAAQDTDTVSVLTVGAALDDCGAELDVHGMTSAAERARRLSQEWRRHRAVPAALLRDSVYEPGHFYLEQARALAGRGELAPALNALTSAFYQGLPFYEPGRMMLHAEPAFRRLRNTRGFVRLNQTRG